jgi:hypothetical protein
MGQEAMPVVEGNLLKFRAGKNLIMTFFNKILIGISSLLSNIYIII